METNTYAPRQHNGINIYKSAKGYKVFLDGMCSTQTKTLRDAKVLIDNALASWATAVNGVLVSAGK